MSNKSKLVENFDENAHLGISVVSSSTDKCTECPECGCREYIHKNELGEGFRMCKDCKQEWWTDIDYNS